METMLREAGFEAVEVRPKEESREYIAQWLPGSNAEDHVVSADIHARKPGGGGGA